MKHVNGADDTYTVQASEENKICRCQSCLFQMPKSQKVSAAVSNVRIPFLGQNSEAKKCCNKIVSTCNLYNGNRDLPSIILRYKEPGLYKNGFTQRIRECGRNLSEKELTVSGKLNKVKDDTAHKDYKEGKDVCISPAQESETTSSLEKELLADIKLCSVKSSLQKKKKSYYT